MFSANGAHAEQCLSQFPDSAWQGGPPKTLPIGNDLILTSAESSYIDAFGIEHKDSYKYTPGGIAHDSFALSDWIINDVSLTYQVKKNTIINVKYVYQGSNCTERTVFGQTPFTLNQINIIDKDNPSYTSELDNVFSSDRLDAFSKNLNFIQKNYLKQGLQDFIIMLDKSKTQPLSSKHLQDTGSLWVGDQIYSIYAQQGIDIRGGESNFGCGFGLFVCTPMEISQDRCMLSTWTPPSSSSPIIYPMSQLNFTNNNATCKLTVLMQSSSGNWVHIGDEYIVNPLAKSSTKSSVTPSNSKSPTTAIYVPFKNQKAGEVCNATDTGKSVKLPTRRVLTCKSDAKAKLRWTY